MKRPWMLRRDLGALDRAHDRIRALAAELTSTERVARVALAERDHHATRNLELQDEACNLRRVVVELRGERRRLLLEAANYRERAETIARAEELSWAQYVLCAARLRELGERVPGAVPE